MFPVYSQSAERVAGKRRCVHILDAFRDKGNLKLLILYPDYNENSSSF